MANYVIMNTRLLAAFLIALGLGPVICLFAADQTPVPAKTVVQISVTDVDAPDGQSLPKSAGQRGDVMLSDNLDELKAEAVREGLTITITPRFSITTFDGAAATVNEQTQIPYMTLEDTAAATGQTVHYAVMTSSLSATPHLNSDGTITLDFRLVESKDSNPAWRELGPPVIVSTSAASKLTFHDSKSRPFLPIFSKDNLEHLSFITVKLVPTKKG